MREQRKAHRHRNVLDSVCPLICAVGRVRADGGVVAFLDPCARARAFDGTGVPVATESSRATPISTNFVFGRVPLS
jgi:hypothetical protein